MEIKKISATEIKDLLDKLYMIQILDVKNYGSIVEDLLKAMEKHPRIKWETKKEISFWYDRIHELRVYHDYIEGKKMIPLKEGKIRIKLRKRQKGKQGNEPAS